MHGEKTEKQGRLKKRKNSSDEWPCDDNDTPLGIERIERVNVCLAAGMGHVDAKPAVVPRAGAGHSNHIRSDPLAIQDGQLLIDGGLGHSMHDVNAKLQAQAVCPVCQGFEAHAARRAGIGCEIRHCAAPLINATRHRRVLLVPELICRGYVGRKKVERRTGTGIKRQFD